MPGDSSRRYSKAGLSDPSLWDVCTVIPASRSTPETDARVDQRFFGVPMHDTSDIDLHNAMPW